jgi:SAM-dependent methyltransferase
MGRMANSKLVRGFPYNGKVGHWWFRRSKDNAHGHAYRVIANFIQASYGQAPRRIVDYACGAGNLLSLLSSRFRHSKLIGLDGSAYLLSLARVRFSHLPRSCAERISLVETLLPNLDIMPASADLVIYCFPNMVHYPAKDYLEKADQKVARSLALMASSQDGGDLPPHLLASQLAQGRTISLNLRQLLVRGGICVRVEYATTQRHELSPMELMHVSYEEGSLDTAVEGETPALWFRVLASSYYRSGVLEDVYEQTADERDKNGGYLITVLKSV